jgi:hypothetical protein
MGGVSVRIRKWEVCYFPIDEAIEESDEIHGFTGSRDLAAMGSSKMRRVLVGLKVGWPRVCYYLHWSNGRDLRALDRLVMSGRVVDGDFSDALVGEAQYWHCFTCGTDFDVVKPEYGSVLLGSLTNRYKDHGIRYTCPVCGVRWNSGVLEFFDSLS